ncbi:hypothetical protein ACFVSN_30570 [Kitasatospora sp. NPDC057904]|uniref:hypothetical protein n=1 Tax=Kitasatospora sp. NPDC057904 TaxID=3346275 RepID=UPI0036D93B12
MYEQADLDEALRLVDLAQQRMPGVEFENGEPLLSEDGALAFIVTALGAIGGPDLPTPVVDELPGVFTFTAMFQLIMNGPGPVAEVLEDAAEGLRELLASDPGPERILSRLRMLCIVVATLPEVVDIATDPGPP